LIHNADGRESLLATGWIARGSIAVGTDFPYAATRLTQPPLYHTMGTGSIPDCGADTSSAKVANDLDPVLRLPSVPAQACHG